MAKTNKELLEEFSELLRQQYYIHRQIHLHVLKESSDHGERSNAEVKSDYWDGGTDSRGVKHKPVWPKLAQAAMDQNLDPTFWVSTLFSMPYLFNHVPRPTDLKNPEVMRRAVNWKQHRSLDLFYATSTEWQTIRREHWTRQSSMAISSAAIARTLIADPRLEASALVRYVMAVLFKQSDLVEMLESAALIQYKCDPDIYKRVFETNHLSRLEDLLKSFAEASSQSGGYTP